MSLLPTKILLATDGSKETLVTGRDGVQTLRVTLAIHEAARTESSVHLPLAENTGATKDNEGS
jgi:hypothetical protein